MIHATITSLNVFPVKSCGGIAIKEAPIELSGIRGDRRWMLVNEGGRYVNERELPRMALITPKRTMNGLTLTAPGMPALHLAEGFESSSREVAVIYDRLSALDADAAASEWLSQFLEQRVFLVRFDPRVERKIHPKFWSGAIDSRIEFSDAFPLLIISRASLDDLNSRLETPLPMDRFRPNIVIDGLLSYDEDRIHELTDGALRLQMARPCTRCKITTTDQAMGEICGSEPLSTLRSYRWNKDLPGVMFGHYAVVAGGIGSPLSVGQRLEIIWK